MKRTHGPHSTHPPTCFGCHVLTVQLSPVPFQPHYNYAVGAYVTNQRDFNDKLKRLGDIQSERTGISSTYEPVHPADLRASPPPETPDTHLPRLVAHDENGHPMHDPITSDYSTPRQRLQREKVHKEAERDVQTKDLIDHA